MRRRLDAEIKAGIFIFAGLSLMAAIILLIGGGETMLQKNYKLFVVVGDVAGLAKGANVRSGGLKIGRISDIDYSENFETLRITMLINEKYQKRIRANSLVRIQTQGVLGDKYLEIVGGSPDQEIVPAEGVLEAEAAKDFSTVLASSQDVMLLLKENLVNLKAITGSLAANGKSEKLFKDLGDTAANLKDITKQLKGGTVQELNATMKNLRVVTDRVKNGEGTIGALFSDSSLYEDLKNLIGGANRNKVLKFFVRQAVKSSDDDKAQKAESEKAEAKSKKK